MSYKESNLVNQEILYSFLYIFYYNFKRSIDEMPDEDFIDMISYLMFSSEDFEDEDQTFDEEWEDEVASFFYFMCL